MTGARRLVVRAHSPWRRAVLSAAFIGALAATAWFSYEYGRGHAGFDGSAARTERARLKDRIAELEDESRAQRLRLAMIETDRAGQARERAELSKTIGEQQAEVARLAGELAFYRGVVEERTSGQVVKIQQFRVTPGTASGEYRLRLVLGRALQPEDAVSGKVRIGIEGLASDGGAQSLDLAALADVAGGELPFNYRFVETLEQIVKLPPGFKPERVAVEAIPARKGADTARQTFLWNVEDS